MANLPSQSPVDYTALLLRLSRMFNSTLDLDEVLSVVMDEGGSVSRQILP